MEKYITMRIPTSDEWDKMMDICHDDNKLTHWSLIYSLINDIESDPKSTYVASCGYHASRLWYYFENSSEDSVLGFRPVFENLKFDAQDGETVVVGTLYMDDKPVHVPINPFFNGDISEYIPDAKLEMRVALSDPAYQVRAIKVGDVYIADRVLLTNISYNDIFIKGGVIPLALAMGI